MAIPVPPHPVKGEAAGVDTRRTERMDSSDTAKEQVWEVRPVRPVMAFYVAAVFLAFMALAYFVFHSLDAVKALFLAAVGGIVSLVPSMVTRIEYSLTEEGLGKRRLTRKKAAGFKRVFSWGELSHVVPTSSGFRYYKRIAARNPLERFFRFHVLSGYSGEIRAEGDDRTRVLARVKAEGVPTSSDEARPRIETPSQG